MPLLDSSYGSPKTSSVSESAGSSGGSSVGSSIGSSGESSSAEPQPPCCVMLKLYAYPDLDSPAYTEYSDLWEGRYEFPDQRFCLEYNVAPYESSGWLVKNLDTYEVWWPLGDPLIYWEDPLGRYEQSGTGNQIEISLTEC